MLKNILALIFASWCSTLGANPENGARPLKLEIGPVSKTLPDPIKILSDDPPWNHAGMLGFSPDGKYLLNSFFHKVGRQGKETIYHSRIAVWDLSQGKVVRRFAPDEWFSGEQFFFNGAIVACSRKGTIQFLSLASGKVEKTWSNKVKPGYRRITALSPDNKFLVTLGREIIIWEMSTGNPKIFWQNQDKAKEQRKFRPLDLAFSPNGNELFALFSRDATLVCFAMPGGKELRSVSRPGFALEALAVGSRKKILAVGEAGVAEEERGGYVTLRDAATFKESTRVKAFAGIVYRVAFTKDDKYLIATGADRPMSGCLLRVWDLATGKQVAGYDFGKPDTISFALSPDGSRIALSTGSVIQIHDWNNFIAKK